MEPAIEYVCEKHREPDSIGPFVTRLDGAWAYCAGHGGPDHQWKRIPPTLRANLDIANHSDKAGG